MQDILAKLARTKKFVYAVTEAIPVEHLLEPPEFSGHYDPHVWFEVPLWELCVETVVKGLSERDPAGKAEYAKRGAELRQRMTALHDWARKKAAELPREKRVLVTSHDAYNYFGRAYGFQVVGLQGISTVTEADLAGLTKLVDFIKQKQVKAIFVESSVPHNGASHDDPERADSRQIAGETGRRHWHHLLQLVRSGRNPHQPVRRQGGPGHRLRAVR